MPILVILMVVMDSRQVKLRSHLLSRLLLHSLNLKK